MNLETEGHEFLICLPNVYMSVASIKKLEEKFECDCGCFADENSHELS